MTPVRVIAPTLAARTQSRQHIDRSKQISHCVSFFSGRRASPAVGARTAAKTCGSRSCRLPCGKELSCGRVRGCRMQFGPVLQQTQHLALDHALCPSHVPLTSAASGAVPVPERTDISSSRLSSQPFIASAETSAIDFTVLLDPIPTRWHPAQLATLHTESNCLRRCRKSARSVVSRICSRAWPFK